jgi:hypothetical protein
MVRASRNAWVDETWEEARDRSTKTGAKHEKKSRRREQKTKGRIEGRK